LVRLSITSFFSVWMFIELNLLLFTSNLIFCKKTVLNSSRTKFFIFQRICGLIRLLLFLILIKRNNSKIFFYFFFLVILFKIGAFPFQFWLLELSQTLSWENLYLLLTFQKFIPLIFIKYFNNSIIFLWARMRWVRLSFFILKVKHTKKLISISSIFFLRLLVILTRLEIIWKKILFIYLLLLSPLLTFNNFLNSSKDFYFKNLRVLQLFTWRFLLISIRGIPPPFLGFILKFLFYFL